MFRQSLNLELAYLIEELVEQPQQATELFSIAVLGMETLNLCKHSVQQLDGRLYIVKLGRIASITFPLVLPYQRPSRV